MTSEFSTPIRVYIEDTDAGGIVNYVNYLKYFERARTESMRALRYDKPAFMDEDAMFVVSDARVRYRSPARLDDQLQATARVVKVGAATLVFDQTVVRAGEILVEGQVTIALVQVADGRPRRLAGTLREQLADQ